jgi:ribose transport system permease protein
LWIPIDVWIAIVTVAIASVIYNFMYFGRYIKAMGGNEEATRLSGINVKAVRVLSFMICSFFTSIAAYIMISRQGITNSTVGPGVEFTSITAAIIGGVSFTSGEGKMWGLVTGVFILAIIENGMQLAGWNQYIQYILKGFILVCAIGFDRYQRDMRVKKGARSARLDESMSEKRIGRL